MKSLSCFARGPILIAAVMAAGVAGAAEPALEAPPDKFPDGKPADLMHGYWLRQADEAARRRLADYEARTAPAQIAEYQARLRGKFLEALGGLPERVPLRAQVTGTVPREGYRVEKIVFESEPKFFVTALLFLPDAAAMPPPWPGVLVPCGHAMDAKGHDTYQSVGALLALNGMAALVFDPIDQGERGQRLGEGGWPKVWGTTAHSRLGLGSALLGRNTARFEIWDGMRGIDYLQSRPEVDPARIGCTGNSGGGTQTSYLMALDERIRAAAPSCYLCGFPALLHTIGPQDAEQDIFGQLAFGMDHGDYVMMRAPSPVLMCTATHDFFDIGGAWTVYREAKRLYTRLGFAERVALMENDAKHNYDKLQREAAVRWLSRWLRGKDEAIVEPPLRLLGTNEVQCTPEGQVLRLPGARSAYDLNDDFENELAPRRAAAWKNGDRVQLLEQVRKLAGIRRLAELPAPAVEPLGAVERPGLKIERLLLKPEDGLLVPALRFVPETVQPGATVLYVCGKGLAAEAAPGGEIERRAREGRTVLALELPGLGQTDPAGGEEKDVFMAYLLGRSYVGLRAECILAAARWLRQPAPVALVAAGDAGIAALHAAALEPGLIGTLELAREPGSWSAEVRARTPSMRAAQIVHGALTVYDLSDLATNLGARLTVAPAR